MQGPREESTLRLARSTRVRLRGVGIGLRARHYREFLEQRPPVDWLEALTENHLHPGGIDRHVLLTLREHYPCALHGVGLGLGSASGFCVDHLRRVADLARDLQPALVSEHLCWASTADRHLNELLPLPFTTPSLELLCARVDQVQDALQRPILLENISTYLRFRHDAMSEIEFLSELCTRTGCGILLDVNNLYVNQANHGESGREVLATVPSARVGEIHLGGHLVTPGAVVDHHGDVVAEPVWDLYRATLSRLGPVPTLIEWDTDIPELDVLLGEAERARAIMREMSCEATPDLDVPPPHDSAAPPGVRGVGLTSPPAPARDDRPAELQSRFAAGLFAAKAPDDFRPGVGESAELRFHRYRHSLLATWDKTLGATFPVIKRLVGDECFAALSVGFGHAHPSESGDLNEFGARFPEFLRSTPLTTEYPYFTDVARLEWAVQRAMGSADGIALRPLDLVGFPPEMLDEARFALAPACALLESPWDIAGIWHAHQADEVVFPEPIDVPCHVLVCRPGWTPQVVALSGASYRLLAALQQGRTFGSALQAALDDDERFDVASFLQQCLALGLFCEASPTASGATLSRTERGVKASDPAPDQRAFQATVDIPQRAGDPGLRFALSDQRASRRKA